MSSGATVTFNDPRRFGFMKLVERGKLDDEPMIASLGPEPLGNGASMNCYATPSPVIEPGRLFVHFGSPITACLDTKTAKVLWQRTDFVCRHYRGPSSSPIAFGNLTVEFFRVAHSIPDATGLIIYFEIARRVLGLHF